MSESNGYCNANKRGGGTCKQVAGFGTNHPGIGRCKHHGGSTKAGTANAAVQMAVMMGQPLDIDPIDAITWCIKITAGEVMWLTERMAELEEVEWLEQTLLGKQLHIYAKERQAAVDRLARYSNMALSLGIQERAVRLAENYGEAIARLFQGVLTDLELTPEQQDKAPMIIRKHLLLIEEARKEPRDQLALNSGELVGSRG